ncbi:hypothetical protein ACNKXS_03355 [Christiangramia marina]|uniref:hypothetical protein n=1 Tax=Christiangramia marina TaxID=409436 RepID=UPI003AA9CC4E
MASWYNNLISKLQFSATGKVAENIKTALESGAFRTIEDSTGTDINVPNEISSWFHSKLKVWVLQLLSLIQEASNYADPSYAAIINTVIQALEVARAYYAKQADTSFNTSLRNVALGKVKILEEIISSVIFGYEQTLKDANLLPVKTIQMTNAGKFEGSSIEDYKWNQLDRKKVIVNHVIFREMEDQTQGNNMKDCEKCKTDYTPWAFAGFCALLAWSASVTKNSKNSK